MWNQVYDPFNNWIFSTLSAALPVVTLLVLIASNKVKAHIAAIIALIVANLVAIFIFTMPSGLALRATVLGSTRNRIPIIRPVISSSHRPRPSSLRPAPVSRCETANARRRIGLKSSRPRRRK